MIKNLVTEGPNKTLFVDIYTWWQSKYEFIICDIVWKSSINIIDL